MAYLEHVNLTVSDPLAFAGMLGDLFGWKIRWQGPSIYNGFTVHVGTDDSYLALYGPSAGVKPSGEESYHIAGSMNHIGIVVDDLGVVEARVKAQGYRTHSHAEYEPGQRFYFDGPDGVEIEVVSYGSRAKG
jgi:catechol 2,3-dioxygenase-like lactoylglutathione lyase family enzyme